MSVFILSQRFPKAWTTRVEYASKCAEAFAAFFEVRPGEEVRADLAAWLLQKYAPLTAGAGERVVAFLTPEQCAEWPVGEIVLDTQREIITELGACIESEPLGSIARALADGHVAARGEAWFPVDLARMKLADRVRSIVAAGFLNDADGVVAALRSTLPGARLRNEPPRPPLRSGLRLRKLEPEDERALAARLRR